jgi:hypothetical protein
MSEYDDILIQCPMPGQEHLPPERLGDFMQTEIGQRVLGSSLENVGVLRSTGMGEEQALTIALGAAAVRDDEGKLMRRVVEEADAVPAGTSEPLESKKK